MNTLIENSLRNLSIEFNSELNISDKFAYIILPHHHNLLLTLIWEDNEDNDENLTLILSLGYLNKQISSTEIFDMLEVNLPMAINYGPKLTYSPTSNLVTLIDSINYVEITSSDIREKILPFIQIGEEIYNNMKIKNMIILNEPGE
ncbi:hypothetical protein [Providencia sp. Me31A]|uniref:hypothetical protein n=1 Tax=Providencia sp. Me31A TaxID=3392637 RepID=UPI003D2656BC